MSSETSSTSSATPRPASPSSRSAGSICGATVSAGPTVRFPIDVDGAEIPFAPLSCDADPTQTSRLVEVDYFGRLSGGRTKERNQRMHFDEIIVNINGAEVVDVDEAGRLKLGTTCDAGRRLRHLEDHRLADGEPGDLPARAEVRAHPDRSARGRHRARRRSQRRHRLPPGADRGRLGEVQGRDV